MWAKVKIDWPHMHHGKAAIALERIKERMKLIDQEIQ